MKMTKAKAGKIFFMLSKEKISIPNHSRGWGLGAGEGHDSETPAHYFSKEEAVAGRILTHGDDRNRLQDSAYSLKAMLDGFSS